MKNVDDGTVPDDVPDMPIEGPNASAKPMPSKTEPKRELRGGTGVAGPLFALPGDEPPKE